MSEPRIGVYICHCGSNIAGTVDTGGVARFAQDLEGVVIARDYKFMCSDPGQELIRKDIKELGLNRVVVAACSLGAEVSIFWINLAEEVRRLKSTDYGVTWGSPELIDYSPTTAINGLAAAYKPNGDLAIFFADQATLYVVKRVDGSWGSSAAWDKSTGDLSGVATVYDGDWNLVVTGKDTSNNYKLWSLVYGCLLYTSPSPRDLSTSRMPSSA
mgnify:CR=1 FL=1